MEKAFTPRLSIEKPPSERLAPDGDDELILEAGAGTNCHQRARGFAIRKEVVPGGRGLRVSLRPRWDA